MPKYPQKGKGRSQRYSPYARALPGLMKAGRFIRDNILRTSTGQRIYRARPVQTLTKRPQPVVDLGEGSGPWADRKVYFNRGDKRSSLQKLIQREILRNSSTDCSYANIATDYIQTSADSCGWAITNGSLLGDYWDFANIANTIGASSNSSTAVPSSFYVKDGVVKHTFANQSNVAGKVIAYHCVARRDVPFNRGNRVGTFTLQSGTNSGNTHGIMNVFFNSLAQASSATAITNWQGPSYVSATPYQAPMFCEYFKIYKTEVFQLEAGGIASTSLKLNKGQTVHSDFLQTSPTEVLCNQGTRFILYKVQGQPSNDNTTKTNVGISPIKIVWTNEVRYHYTYSVNNKTVVTAPSTAYATLTTASVLEPATGGATTFATA